MRKDEIESLIKSKTRIEVLIGHKNVIDEELNILYAVADNLVSRYGNTGKIFRSGNQFIQCGKPDSFASLMLVYPEDAK